MQDWIADQIVSGKISAFKMDRSADRELRALGVPPKDLKWVSIAKGSGAEDIVTEDIDLFDPKAKGVSSKTRKKILTKGGKVSSYLKKKHGIYVRCAEAFVAFCSD